MRSQSMTSAKTLRALERGIRHPEFQYCSVGHDVPIVFVFGRDVWMKPSAEQLADYDRREAIVKENGGLMRLQRWETAGKNPSFTKDDVEAAIAVVKSAHPRLDVYTNWNGAGCYSMSIGARHAAALKRNRTGRR